MKNMLIAGILTLGSLLPSNEVKSSIVHYYTRVVDVTIAGWVLTATSEPADGTISQIEVFRLSNGERVRNQSCSGYSCNVSLSGLASGLYSVKVTCQNTTYKKQFSL